MLNSNNFWSYSESDTNPCIEINFDVSKNVKGIIVESNNKNSYLTGYTLEYSIDNIGFNQVEPKTESIHELDNMWFKPIYDNSNQSICYFNNIILANKVCLYPKKSNTNEIDIRVALIAWDWIEDISMEEIIN